MKPELDRIREKIDLLSRLDAGRDVFGAKHHHYQLNPCLSRRTISDVEWKYDIWFPPDYIDFLTQIGNGGCGPDYGLYPLEKSMAEHESWNAYFRQRSRPPFQLHEPFSLDSDDALRIIDERTRDPKSYFALPLPRRFGGAIEIVHRGCSFYFYLVVTGEQHGRVWNMASLKRTEWCPATKDFARGDFLSWYEAWLDHWLQPGTIEFWRNALNRTSAAKPAPDASASPEGRSSD